MKKHLATSAQIATKAESIDFKAASRPSYYSWLVRRLETSTYQYLLLSLMVAIAVTLRLYKLGEWSFWGDEMFAFNGREDGFNYDIFRQSISLALIQNFTSWLGINEWNARLIPALFGIISIPTIFYFVKKIFNPVTGLLAALLLAISPWHIYWSQNARFYTALLLFFSLASFFFYLGIEQDRPGFFIISLFFLGLAAKERLLALYLVPIVLVYLFLLWLLPYAKPPGLRVRNLILFFAPGLIPGLFLVFPYLRNPASWLEGFGYANNNPFWVSAGIAYYVGLPVICLAAVGSIYLFKQKSRAGLFFSISALLPPLVLAIIAPYHYTANRYAFVALPAFIILASTAVITLIPKTTKFSPILPIGLLLILLSQSIGDDLLYYQVQNGNRDDWKAAFSYVQKHKDSDDIVVTANPDLGNYYLQDETVAFYELDLSQIEQISQTTWFVEDRVAPLVYPRIHNWLEQKASLVSSFDVNFQARTFTMRVYRYEPVASGTS